MATQREKEREGDAENRESIPPPWGAYNTERSRRQTGYLLSARTVWMGPEMGSGKHSAREAGDQQPRRDLNKQILGRDNTGTGFRGEALSVFQFVDLECI